MFRKLLKNKKAQNTAEYAILIALVVAGIIAVQTFAQRALQAKVREGAVWMSKITNVHGFGNKVIFEAQDLTTNYDIESDSMEMIFQNNETLGQRGDDTRTRKKDGYRFISYCEDVW